MSKKYVYLFKEGNASMRELLGTWAENAGGYEIGQTVSGIVRSIESYGIFIELAPNLAGLAEPKSDVYIGQTASVYIKSLNPERMKVKLIVIDTIENETISREPTYFIEKDHIERWVYSPPQSVKLVETIFK